MLRKNLLKILLVTTVVGSIAIKASSKPQEYSTHVNQSKVSYKEKFINNVEIAIPNRATTKNIQNIYNQSNSDFSIEVPNTTKKVSENINENSASEVNISTENENTTEKATENINENSTSEVNTPTENESVTERVDENVNTNLTPEIDHTTIYYDRTTSIYADDNKTLLRVEYYSNNKLVYYSDIEEFDIATKSYIEKIYQWNYEKNTENLIRTDIYSNGILINSY